MQCPVILHLFLRPFKLTFSILSGVVSNYTCNLLILNPLSQLICCMPTSQDSPLLHLNFSAVSTFIASQGDFEYVSRLANT